MSDVPKYEIYIPQRRPNYFAKTYNRVTESSVIITAKNNCSHINTVLDVTDLIWNIIEAAREVVENLSPHNFPEIIPLKKLEQLLEDIDGERPK